MPTTRGLVTLEQRRAEYPPHPAHLPLIAAHGHLFSALPQSTPGMVDHLNGLADMWSECVTDVTAAGAYLADQYPVERAMHSYYAAYGATYQGMADGARQAAVGFALANAEDMRRNLHPRNNEEWNDVPESGEQGVDMGPIRQLFREAHMQMWMYRYQNPLDLLEWLKGMYATNLAMGRQINPDMPLAAFPGAGAEIYEFWARLGATLPSIGAYSATLAEAYEISAADVLRRHTNPRPNEALANAGRRNL